MNTQCLFCGNTIQLIFVHGHYQCPVCNTNALPCCDGDNCNNAFLDNIAVKENKIIAANGALEKSGHQLE